ncbi:MAG: hypothetical protein NTV58_16510 [Deltaproteobacteria bacterium]|nr:hypothetical protein [Deltaproteobacteria bacterium]
MKDKFFTFIIILLSCLISVLAAELFLRFFLPQPLYSFEKGLFMSSPDYGYALTPNVEKYHRQPDYNYTIKSNSKGFRGREPGINADTRILVLGDSYGMGQGVSEGKSICDLAHQHFKGSVKSLDIFNTSISGYAGINEIGVLKRQLKDYKPHIVILLFFWNDLGVTESLRVQNGYLVVNYGNSQTAPLREWLNNNSHFYALLKRSWYAFKSPKAKTADPDPAIPQSDIDVALDYIIRMKGICDQQNTVFVTILLPVDGVYAGSPAMQACRETMIKELKKNAVLYRDWTLIVPQEGKKQYIFGHDQHWNELGNAYFSRYLIQVIDDVLK